MVESPGAINGVAKVSQILSQTVVEFTTDKRGIPSIYATFPVSGECWLATLQNVNNQDYVNTSQSLWNWWVAHPCGGYGKGWHGHESSLFSHLTKAAKQLVLVWIESLCAEYDRRLEEAYDDAPEIPPSLEEQFS